MIKINCKYNDQGAWCKNKQIKRSLCGIGARICVEYPPLNGQNCKYAERYAKPNCPSPAIRPRR